MLQRFIKIYTWVVASLIVVLLALAVWNLAVTSMPYRGYLCLFLAVLAVGILFVTRMLVRKNLPKDTTRRRPSR